jgi:transposase
MADQIHPMLFDEQTAPVPELSQPRSLAAGVARVLMPNRAQLELRASDLESLLPEGHRARLVWAWVERADLSAMYAGIRAVEGGSGRTAIAPEILFALWLYATLEGMGSARGLARLAQEHDAYRWICGGVSVNYHTLADFRTAHGEALDALLTDSVAALLSVGAVTLKRVAQDGTRVRASAGAASFRRGATLELRLQEARTQVERLKGQIEADPGAGTRRERAARERQERVERALKRLPEMAEIKAKQGKKREEARVSTTDAEATVMKMGDGGFRPAYNAQFTTDTEDQVIVGVEAATVGTDMAQLSPMVEQVGERYGKHPKEWLVDGGYPAHEQIDQAAEHTKSSNPPAKPGAFGS